MRALVVVVAVLGCKPSINRLDHLQIPEVKLDDAVVAPTGPIPPIVLIDEHDTPSLAVVEGPWESLATADPKPVVTLASETWRYAGYHLVLAGYWHDDDAKTVVSLVQTAVSPMPAGPQPYIPDDGSHYYGHGPHDVLAGREIPMGPPGGKWAPEITGEVRTSLPERLPALVLAHPRASAEAVIHAVVLTGGVIGVNSGGAVRPLRIAFADGSPEHATKQQPARAAISIDAVNVSIGGSSIPWTNGALDAEAVATALATWKHPAGGAVDVHHADGVDAQHLVDVLAALEHAGVKAVGLGRSK